VPNALARESSPYLRQHAENPVDWLPWSPLALARARERDVPILLSIGYSSCHWCHVMERESFEDPAVAALMNERFVCVKVDREERPDLDALYMEAVQGFTGHGGWPLNVFLTPEQVPFYGGTYYPSEPRHGLPSWTQILQGVSELWRERAGEIRATREAIVQRLAGAARLTPSTQPIEPAALEQAVANLESSFDPLHGGFGGAPKFPPSATLEFLLRRAAGEHATADAAAASPASPAGAESPEGRMALATLRAIARGGIHDQVGGGFHRYAVDAGWTVPHFEKMLYDNALLARAFLHGHRLDPDPLLLEACTAALEWALREMRGPEGAFYSALDADSEGVEGRFYVWTPAELREVLGEDAEAAIAWFGASETGNFPEEPGLNVLQAHGPEPPRKQRERIRARLLERRAGRVRPGLDDKRLTAWNALMISALAEAGSVLDEPRYLEAAERCADLFLDQTRPHEGHLLHTSRGGVPGERRLSRTLSHVDTGGGVAGDPGGRPLGAFLEDHAFLLEALLALFEATCESRRLTEARALADEMIARFADPERGGFFSTALDDEPLIIRRKDLEDAPIPSGSSSAALGLLRLAHLTGEPRYEEHALGVLALAHEIAPRHPTAFGHLLQAVEVHLSPAQVIACAVPPARGRGPGALD
jgi:hypothetical protein